MSQKFPALPGIYYFPKKDHRDQTPEKSQWTISEEQERICFTESIRKGWNIPEFKSWGLHFDGTGKVTYVGISASENSERQELIFAKFIDSTKNNCWHGYPANHTKNQDRPPLEVLESWRQKGYLPKKKIANIQKGQKCKL